MEEINCIHAILQFIETNFNKTITVKELEQVSFYSYRNIQRIFKYTCGETIGAYQKRLKLENAYKLILYTKNNFSEIAFEVGFENNASFSKAFKLQYGISPKEARQNKVNLIFENGIIPKISTKNLQPEIIYIPEKTVFYQTTKTNYVNNEIEILWEKFLQNSFPENGIDYFGVVADEPLITDKINCRYDAAASIKPNNKYLASKKIFGGKYAKFLHHGNYDSIEETYHTIYAGWILNTDLEFDISPIIEHYINHSSNTKHESDFITAILIPIKK